MKYFFLLAAILAFISCDKNPSELEPASDPNPEDLKFEGNYQIKSVITDGMYDVYDSLGNMVGYEYQTFTKEDNLSITFKDGDTLLVNGFYYSLQGNRIEEIPTLLNDNDKLDILFDYSDEFKKEEIIGTVWLEGDSIHLEYNWDKTWSTAPVPNKGSIRSRGIRL